MKASLRVLAGMCVFAGACIAFAAEPGNPDNGKRLYVTVGCFACHGSFGEGMPGPALAETQKVLPLEAFSALVRLGPNDMPAYTKDTLPDKDLADIFAYLRTLPGPADPKSFPLLYK